MADVKISAGADPGPLLGTDKIPLARAPSTTAFAATMAEVASYASTVAATPAVNYADNSGFSVNQRTYVSGAALAAGVYGFDRWKAGAGGCTLTFTASPPSTTVTITAGTLQQVVEGASVQGGNYMLSWVGTAQGRVGGGAYAASPVAVAGIAAGANTTIEFNTGTLGQVKFVAGTAATAWLAAPAQQELAKCQRFYQLGTVQVYGSTSIVGGPVSSMLGLPVSMRANPTVTPNWTTQTNITGPAISILSPAALLAYGTATAAGPVVGLANFTASTDL